MIGHLIHITIHITIELLLIWKLYRAAKKNQELMKFIKGRTEELIELSDSIQDVNGIRKN